MLRPIEIENLARQAVKAVLQGAKAEDSIIELKRTLSSDHRIAARQIAALCNAASGNDVVWVVGIGEDGTFSPPTEEFATWGPSVNKFFDEVFPVARCYNISYDDHPLTLIHFSTEMRPFVVLGKDGNREVPWRHLNSTRGAKRGELLGLFLSASTKPILKIVKAQITRERSGGPLNIGMTVYIIPRNESKVVLPTFKCSVRAEFSGQVLWIPAKSVSWSQIGHSTKKLQFILNEPSFVAFVAKHHQPGLQDPLPKLVKLILQVGYATDLEDDAISVDLPETNLTREVQHFEWLERGWVAD